MYMASPTTILYCMLTKNPLCVSWHPLHSGVLEEIGVYTPLQRPLWVVYFLDSGGGTYPELVYPDQISWFNQTASHIRESYGPIPALAFFHIPRYLSVSLSLCLSLSLLSLSVSVSLCG